MKKIILMLVLLFTILGTSNLFAGNWINVKEKPLKKGTPEYTACEYNDALIKKDKGKILSLADEKMKKKLTENNNAVLDKMLRNSPVVNKDEFYQYLVTHTKGGSVTVDIKIKKTYDVFQKYYEIKIHLRKVGDKYLVTSK